MPLKNKRHATGQNYPERCSIISISPMPAEYLLSEGHPDLTPFLPKYFLMAKKAIRVKGLKGTCAFARRNRYVEHRPKKDSPVARRLKFSGKFVLKPPCPPKSTLCSAEGRVDLGGNSAGGLRTGLIISRYRSNFTTPQPPEGGAKKPPRTC